MQLTCVSVGISEEGSENNGTHTSQLHYYVWGEKITRHTIFTPQKVHSEYHLWYSHRFRDYNFNTCIHCMYCLIFRIYKMHVYEHIPMCQDNPIYPFAKPSGLS